MAAETRWILRPGADLGLPEFVPITVESITIGRKADNTLCLPAERFPRVSGHHASVQLDKHDVVVRDLNSTNGTLVSGEAITERVLKHGEAFELGVGGPRFVVLLSSVVEDAEGATLHSGTVDDRTVPGPRRSIGTQTMMMLCEKLGIPDGGNVRTMLESHGRRSKRTLIVVSIVLTLALLAGLWWLGDLGVVARRELEAKLQRHESAVQETRAEWEREMQEIEVARRTFRAQREKLEAERERVTKSLRELEQVGSRERGEFERLRRRLVETTRALASYDPVDLEKTKLEKVHRVEKCVVMIEVLVTFTEAASGKRVYVRKDANGGWSTSFDDSGELLKKESNGSGFCVTEEGWIVTNAHVVQKKREVSRVSLGGDVELVEDLRVHVVFSGSSKRRMARVVRWASVGNEDLALLKVEPFERMPCLAGLDLGIGRPERGADVYLIGFPLGTNALQQGDTVIASTFRGIVSRFVSPYLQVDAAVHPGQSGGPAIDARGNVIGIVVGMQNVHEGQGSSAIGYIIPVADARSIWPPPVSK